MQNTFYCFGIINLDILVHPVDEWPVSGELVQADHILFSPGGSALNTAVTIRKLGAQRVELLGCIGEDEEGIRIEKALSNLGIGTKGLTLQSARNTGTCIVSIQSSGERSFIYSSGANDAVGTIPEYLEQINNGSIVHLGGVLDMAILAGESLIRIVDELKEKNCYVSMDLAWDWRQHGWESIKSSLKQTDVVVMNDQEAFNLTGCKDVADTATKIFNEGCPFVVIKLGRKGAYVCTKDYRGVIPGFSVESIDTTGAGDAFSGALLVAISKNQTPAQAVRFANAVGACCVQKIGPCDGIKSYEETLRFIEEH